MKYVLEIRSKKEAVTGERHGGARGRQINNFGQAWKKFHGNQGFGGDGKGEPHSRNQGRVERHSR